MSDGITSRTASIRGNECSVTASKCPDCGYALACANGAGRLKGENESFGMSISYQYDRNGNREHMAVSGTEPSLA